MESYSALAASYDELTQDVGYEKRAAFVEKLFLRSHIRSTPCSTSPAAPAR